MQLRIPENKIIPLTCFILLLFGILIVGAQYESQAQNCKLLNEQTQNGLILYPINTSIHTWITTERDQENYTTQLA